MNIEQQIDKMTKSQKDFIGVWGNQWAPRKTVPFVGTCELCTWGKGEHSDDCVVKLNGLLAEEASLWPKGQGVADVVRASSYLAGNWPHSSGE